MSILPHKAPQMWGAKKQGQIVHCTYNGSRMEFLGSGRFTNAFRHTRYSMSNHRDVLLFTFWEDFSKSIMAHAVREIENPGKLRIPLIRRVKLWAYRGKSCNIYLAHYIEPFGYRRRTRAMCTMLNTLQEIHEEGRDLFKGDMIEHTNRCDEFNAWIIDACTNHGIPDPLIETLSCLRFVAQDWGDHYIFDNFSEKNVGVIGRNLYLLDPMFDADKLHKDAVARSRRSRQQSRIIHAIDNYMS